MSKPLICLHAASILSAYCLLGLSYLFMPRTTHVNMSAIVVARLITVLAGIGWGTGMWVLAVTPGRNKIVAAVAVSTVVAFLLFVLSL